MSIETIDYFWSFRSHYAYLSIDRVIDLNARWPVEVRLRPVLPLLLREPEYFSGLAKSRVNRWGYVQHDAERIAERLNIPFGWPDPDPVALDPERYAPAPEQPHIHKLNSLAIEADRAGVGLEFTAALARQIFSPHPGWNEPKRLQSAAREVGLDLDNLLERIAADPASYAAEVDANVNLLEAAGHWGVPTLVFRNEAFFGQDRIDDLKWRLEQCGIKPA